MATGHYENGIIGTTEGHRDIYSDIFVTGDVVWLDSVNGNDSNSGFNRNLAKATLSSAYGAIAANNGDVIIIESGHSETLTSSQSLATAGVTIYGLGSGSNKPNFTVNGNIDMLSVAAVNQKLVNLRFPVGTAAHTSRIDVAAAGCVIEDCDFLCGANDLESITIPDAGDYCTIKSCTFTISADGPDAGIEIESATVIGLNVVQCTFDGGDYDFDAAGINSGVAHTEFFYDRNTLSNKASIIHTAASKGLCTGSVLGDGSRVEL